MSSPEVSYRRWVLFITCMGSLMAPLDSTIVSVSLPEIAQDLGMDYAEIIWVPTANLVTVAVMILVMGRVSDLYGRKRIFIAGFGIFTLGSLLCSVATTGNELIIFRIFQAFDAKDGGTLTRDYILNARQYVPLSYRNELAFRLYAAYADGSQPSIYYFGGFDTLRGYSYSALAGNRAAYLNRVSSLETLSEKLRMITL